MKRLIVLVIVCTILGACSYASRDVKTDTSQDLKPGKNKVSYLSGGEKIVADLYIPKDYIDGQKKPVIVITPPASGVKEQTAGLYAEKLSDKGFITLAFDPRGFGESDGHALLLDPYRITEDIDSSVSFIRTLDHVDANNVFNMGVCAGAGFAAHATSLDARVKALIMVSPYLTTQDDFFQRLGGPANIRTRLLPGGAAAQQKYFETGENMMIQMVPTTEKEAKAARPIAKGMMEYYLPGKPGDVPNWKNNLSLMSMGPMLSFSVYNYAFMLEPVPVYMAYGDKAISAGGAKRFYDALNGSKEQLVVKGAGHFDMYWKPEYVDPTVEGVSDFLKKTSSK